MLDAEGGDQKQQRQVWQNWEREDESRISGIVGAGGQIGDSVRKRELKDAFVLIVRMWWALKGMVTSVLWPLRNGKCACRDL